ncbi:MAG: 4'-phosphopantetheinyl transferase superfamily protein [Desulfobacterales bacterium]|jgi:4'-phosphopantetheinyl transferase
MSKSPALRAVILAVPETARTLPPPERVVFLSRHARKALQISATESHLTIGTALKDREGRPRPVEGVYWSLTHKPAYVGAIVARRLIGIDIETIVQRKTEALFEKVADSDEWALIGSRSWEGFHRYWTAKEAVLKADGTGLEGLSRCRVVAIPDKNSLIVQIKHRRMIVEHFYFDGHIASVAKTTGTVHWTLIGSSADMD